MATKICSNCKSTDNANDLMEIEGVSGLYCSKCIKKALRHKTVGACKACGSLIYLGKDFSTYRYALDFRKDKVGSSFLLCSKCRDTVLVSSHEEVTINLLRTSNKTNIKRVKLLVNNRQELEKDSIKSLTDEQWQNCQYHFDNSCAYCGKTNTPLSKDHFIPLSSGGNLTEDNVIPVCKSCNSSKRDREFYSWYPRQPFYSKERESRILKYLNIINKGARHNEPTKFTRV